MDWAIVGRGRGADGNGGARVALTNMGATPMRAAGVEEALAGGCRPGRGGRAAPPRGRTRRRTPSGAPSTGASCRRCWCAAASRRRWPVRDPSSAGPRRTSGGMSPDPLSNHPLRRFQSDPKVLSLGCDAWMTCHEPKGVCGFPAESPIPRPRDAVGFAGNADDRGHLARADRRHVGRGSSRFRRSCKRDGDRLVVRHHDCSRVVDRSEGGAAAYRRRRGSGAGRAAGIQPVQAPPVTSGGS